jgi:hypothetical protein
MKCDPTHKNKHHPGGNLPEIDDTYVFDGSSGLYKPKSISEQEQRKGKQHYRIFGTLPVHIRTDWLAFVVSRR